MSLAKAPNPTDKFVGTRVRMARVMAGMSQEKLGEHLGITFQQVQKYEKGANRIGSSRLQEIATAVKQPVSWFFDEGRAEAARGDADLVTRMLTTPHGLLLAQSFLTIKNNKVRHHVADIASTLAQAGA